MIKRFAYKSISILVISTLVFVYYLIFFGDGQADPYYIRFTTGKYPSLIIGSSRSAQGVLPSILNESNLDFERPIFNFSFTNIDTPYGPYYLESIKKKIRGSNNNNGLFIIDVTPILLATNKSNITDDPTFFREKNSFVHQLLTYHTSPNLEYLLRFYQYPYYKMSMERYIRSFLKQSILLHDDGWLEINVPMDKSSILRRTNSKLNTYKKMFEQYTFSQTRLIFLKKTIEYLKQHGKVYLVRIPVSPEMLEMENIFLPDFNHLLEDLALATNCQYLNLSNYSDSYLTIDGNHLWKDESSRFTSMLVNYVNQLQ